MGERGGDARARAAAKPVRVASKSIRCRALLEAILGRDERFRGLMTYTLPETLWLAEQGFEDLLLAYPTADVGALEELALRSAANPEGAPIVMVDCVEHLEMIESVLGKGAPPMRVCIDVDASWWWLGGRVKIGPKRSPIHTVEQAVALAREIEKRPQIELDALMAYEGQISGVGDLPPGQRLRGAAIRFMQRRSAAEIAERRGAIVAALSEFVELEIVNGGGTGSLELTAAEEAVTEVTAGSGFYAPVPLRPLQPLQPHPGGGLRAAGHAQALRVGGDGARRRLPRLRPRQPRPPARALAARGAALRRRGGRRRGADAAARPAGGGSRASATASTSATPKPASSASASTPSTWSKATQIVDEVPTYRGEGELPLDDCINFYTGRIRSRVRDQDAVGVLVGEDALGVEGVAGALELIPGRVARRQGRGRLEVALAPVGAAAVVVHDRLDRLEVGAPLHPPVLVDGDVGGVAFVRGAEAGVVAGGDPHLDREEDRVAVRAHPLDHPPRRLRPVPRAAARTPSR